MPETALTKKLRIGLLLSSREVPAWQYLMLQKVLESDAGEIAVIVLLSDPQNGRLHTQNGWLTGRLLKIDARLFRPTVDAFSKCDLRELLPSVPVMTVIPERNRGRLQFRAEDVKKLKEHALDVLIPLDHDRLAGDILDAARFGVWTHRPAQGNGTALPIGYDEVLQDRPQTVSSLVARRKGAPEIELYRSSSCTYRYSMRENCNRHHWRMAAFVPRALARVRTQGEAAFERTAGREGGTGERPPETTSVPAWVKFLSRIVTRAIYRQLFVEHWILLYHFSDDILYRFKEYRKLIPPKDRLWADPHVLFREGKYYVFFEEMIFDKENRGHIALVVIDETGACSEPMTVLEEPHHLSYPFVFEWENEIYMIPETAGAGAVRLYKCARFPDKWEFQYNLMENVEANDVTLFCKDHRWWLFASIKEHDGYPNWDELFLFYADSPVSRSWQPHPKNPVVSDVTSARPAGKLFERNGALFRPAQNSSHRYGYGLKINRILKLTETEYEEEEVESFAPDWEKNIKAVHSYNRAGKLSVIDARLRRWRYF